MGRQRELLADGSEDGTGLIGGEREDDQREPDDQRNEERYDLVLVDSPPVNVVTDAQLMASGCDAVLLVGRAFSTTSNALEDAIRDLQQFRVIGTVLNGSAGIHPYGRYRSYY